MRLPRGVSGQELARLLARLAIGPTDTDRYCSPYRDRQGGTYRATLGQVSQGASPVVPTLQRLSARRLSRHADSFDREVLELH